MAHGTHTVTFASDSVAADSIFTIWTTGDKLAYTCTLKLKVNGINKEMHCIQVIKLNLIACPVYKSVRPQ